MSEMDDGTKAAFDKLFEEAKFEPLPGREVPHFWADGRWWTPEEFARQYAQPEPPGYDREDETEENTE